MQHAFNFSKVKIWNRTQSKAVKLCQELNLGNVMCVVCDSAREAAQDADVICTTTGADKPILESEWVKNGAHICAVGANRSHHSEISVPLHRRAAIIVDSMDTAKEEFADFIQQGIRPWGEVGDLINGRKSKPNAEVTIFYSLGMAIEDVLSAQLIYENYKKSS